VIADGLVGAEVLQSIGPAVWLDLHGLVDIFFFFNKNIFRNLLFVFSLFSVCVRFSRASRRARNTMATAEHTYVGFDWSRNSSTDEIQYGD
jgi:hypothetical protein